MKSQCFYFYLFILLLVLPMLAAANDAAWTPVPNVNDPVIQNYGRTAVTDYNESSKKNLQFVVVISAGEINLAGLVTTQFRLTLTVLDGSVTNTCVAIIQKASGILSLVSFIIN
jgi:hypothetical protein